mmetsp:Transcript_5254/g.10260  ORF Transcript_5254/g.10260 Transcript_5254/m.10260 type:complete len:225 (-) Transcript_5254:527-1201(-)
MEEIRFFLCNNGECMSKGFKFQVKFIRMTLWRSSRLWTKIKGPHRVWMVQMQNVRILEVAGLTSNILVATIVEEFGFMAMMIPMFVAKVMVMTMMRVLSRIHIVIFVTTRMNFVRFVVPCIHSHVLASLSYVLNLERYSWMTHHCVDASLTRAESDMAVAVDSSFVEAIWNADFGGYDDVAFHLHLLVIAMEKVRFLLSLDVKVSSECFHAEMKGVRVSCIFGP